MQSGTVKWFNNSKGIGFITPNEGGEDVFVHFTAIQVDGLRALSEGQHVQFSAIPGEHGLRADKVKPTHMA